MAGCIEIETLIRSYDWEDDIALQVFWCESRFNPLALGGLDERGIAQIHPIHRNQFDWENAYNPKVNLDYAYKLWRDQGWQPWSCYTQTCIGIEVGWNPCTLRWYMPDGWSYEPAKDTWHNPDNIPEWGGCTWYGGRYNFVEENWFTEFNEYDGSFGWNKMPTC